MCQALGSLLGVEVIPGAPPSQQQGFCAETPQPRLWILVPAFVRTQRFPREGRSSQVLAALTLPFLAESLLSYPVLLRACPTTPCSGCGKTPHPLPDQQRPHPLCTSKPPLLFSGTTHAPQRAILPEVLSLSELPVTGGVQAEAGAPSQRSGAASKAAPLKAFGPGSDPSMTPPAGPGSAESWAREKPSARGCQDSHEPHHSDGSARPCRHGVPSVSAPSGWRTPCLERVPSEQMTPQRYSGRAKCPGHRLRSHRGVQAPRPSTAPGDLIRAACPPPDPVPVPPMALTAGRGTHTGKPGALGMDPRS